jgi:hypothetical protein
MTKNIKANTDRLEKEIESQTKLLRARYEENSFKQKTTNSRSSNSNPKPHL